MIPKTRNIPWIAQDRIVAYIFFDVLTLYAASRSARGLEKGFISRVSGGDCSLMRTNGEWEHQQVYCVRQVSLSISMENIWRLGVGLGDGNAEQVLIKWVDLDIVEMELIIPINNCEVGIVTCGSKLDLMVTD